MEISELLTEVIDLNASDLFISVGAPPIAKVEGITRRLREQNISSEDAHRLIYSIMSDEQIQTFEQELELNMGLNLGQQGRFRVNVYRQRGEPAMVIRCIKTVIPTLDELKLPACLKYLARGERGLVLVVGATGTGKSTTLAAMLEYRSRTRDGHIITVEDPIEFIHQHQRSLVDQREVGFDTKSYHNALINALREAPDVIMIGEIRDRETMQQAIHYAETGHLCISTLHASNANQAMERILAFFSAEHQKQVLLDLSLHLQAIISQRLAIGVNGKRIAAVETLINTPYIAELIAQGKIETIREAMEHSENLGCKTFDAALYELWEQGLISESEALHHADSRNNLGLRFRLKQPDSNNLIIQRDINFDQNLLFTLYRSFRLVPLTVDKGHRTDMQHVLTQGLSMALTAKGLKEDLEHPDLEIQFAFGLKQRDGLSLAPMPGENTLHKSGPEYKEGTLIIKMVDTNMQETVWRMIVTHYLPKRLRTQEEVNHDCQIMLKDFPPLT